MEKIRSVDILSPRLKKVLTRDGIIVFHFLTAVIAIIHIEFYTQVKDVWFKTACYIIAAIFTIFGLIRLFWHDFLEHRPLVSILFYMVILSLTALFFADYGQAYDYMFVVPIMLASIFYSRKLSYFFILIVGIVLLLQPIVQEPIYAQLVGPQITLRNYATNITTFLMVVALSQIIIDATYVSESDRYALEQAYKKLDTEQQKLQSLLSSMTDGVVGIDIDGVINFFNPSLLNLIDSHISPIGQKLVDVTKLNKLNGKDINIFDYVKDKKSVFGDDIFVINYNENDKVYVNVVSRAISNRQGESEGYVLVIRDITRQYTEEENRQTFLSLMAHEMRTPATKIEAQLSNISYFAQKGSKFAKEIVETAKQSYKSAVRLTGIINELNLLLESGTNQLPIKSQEIDISKFLKSLAADYQDEAKSKDIDIRVIISEEAKSSFAGSEEYIKKILQTAMDNSIKFMNKGTIEVSAERQEDKLVFRVKDSGPGIPRSILSSILKQSFVQAENFETRSQGGLGIGLYVASRVAQLIGGSMSVESELGEGTAVYLYLPVG